VSSSAPTFQAPTAPVDPWVPRYRKFAFVLVLAAAFAGGVVASLGVQARALAVMTFASAVSVWCGLDARIHGKLFLRSFAWLMLLTWPVGLLAHLVWTRRWRGTVMYVVLALTYAAATAGGMLLGGALGRL
jgi:hypothetical protein